MYENPIVRGCYPDPSICRVGADYYLAASSFEYFPGVPILHSRDLLNWRTIGHALTRKTQLPLDGVASSQGIYAPTLRHHAGTFYLVTTRMPAGESFLVTTRDPAGAWSDPIYIREDSWSMDPSLFFDADGTVYYTRHGERERGRILQAALDVTTGTLREPVRELWAGSGGIWPEGPHLYRIGDLYYLLIAEGGTWYEHSITVARSSSPWGPFEPCPHNPILTHRHLPEHPIQALGHGDLVQTEAGAWWLVCLGLRPALAKHHHLGRETFLAPVRFDERGWPVVNGAVPLELYMPSQGLPERAPLQQPALVRDDFAAPELALEWNFIRNPEPACWSLDARPGYLRLLGGAATLDDVASPTFVGRRQQHFRCRASAALELAEGPSGAEAGLTLRMNERHHFELFLCDEGGARRARVRQRCGDECAITSDVALKRGRTELVIEAHREHYEFSLRVAGAAPVALGSGLTAPLSTEVAGGFTGVYIGMYATRRGAPAAPPADFDWFEYAALDA